MAHLLADDVLREAREPSRVLVAVAGERWVAAELAQHVVLALAVARDVDGVALGVNVGQKLHDAHGQVPAHVVGDHLRCCGWRRFALLHSPWIRGARLKKTNTAESYATDSPRSGEISTKVGVDSALRSMVVKGGSQRQNTSMGVDNAVCLFVSGAINPHRDLAL